MSDRTHTGVVTHEGSSLDAPYVVGTGIHPTSPSHEPAGGAHTLLGLERESASEAVGQDATAKPSTVVLTPASDPSLPPHISAPGDAAPQAASTGGAAGQKIKEKVKEVWYEVKEITPGTKEHQHEFGTGTALGGYRSQMGKR